ncbi:MAG: aminotransferase class V-fold PLP-dependent enzyme [Bacteroidaceae bacterium]|nr:aminotransferase class V-fold PLP-dependent enzyme [Bacteroidaceae bacterium]
MIQFQCDYNEGAHPLIMENLLKTNMEQTEGYGLDPYCEQAREAIRNACKAPDADVHFLVGGTQANATVINSILRPYQGVVCADNGHINVHETGAIEHGGHKCLAHPSKDGKINAEQLDNFLAEHFTSPEAEHMVQPGMVYISFPTECGTLYTHDELAAISKVCKGYDIPLFVDGARLGYGIIASKGDVTLESLTLLADVFYIGGTKVGALFGEAIVITNAKLKKDFRYNIKQNGGMLAKGRLLGIQFLTLFTDNLYFRIAEHAICEAMRIKSAFLEAGIEMFVDSPSNQQFPILTQSQIATLAKDFLFESWGKVDADREVIRFCTSWATKPENTDTLIEAIKRL